jgi:hypothetical protein
VKRSQEAIDIKPTFIEVVLIVAIAGCESEPKSDDLVPIDQVPANVMEVARKQLPGFTFDMAYKMKLDGKDAYEVRGKDKRGKVREVEVSVTGEVIAIE